MKRRKGTCYFSFIHLLVRCTSNHSNDTCCYIIWSVSLYCQTTSSQAVHETLGSTDPHHWYLDTGCSTKHFSFLWIWSSIFSWFLVLLTSSSIGFLIYLIPLLLAVIYTWNNFCHISLDILFSLVVLLIISQWQQVRVCMPQGRRDFLEYLDLCWLSTLYALSLVSTWNFSLQSLFIELYLRLVEKVSYCLSSFSLQ